MFCPQCGANVPNSASFCSSCGSALSQSTPAYQAQPVVVTQVYQNPTSGYQQGNYGYAANQWQPATTPELGGPARKIDTNRGILKYLIFTLLTFGIYGMWFIYKMAQDMNTMCEDDDQNTGGLLAFILLSFITLGIYAIYWWYKIAERTYVNAPPLWLDDFRKRLEFPAVVHPRHHNLRHLRAVRNAHRAQERQLSCCRLQPRPRVRVRSTCTRVGDRLSNTSMKRPAKRFSPCRPFVWLN